MSQSIDFRINDLISEYLDYKGYTKTVSAFRDERQTRNEPIGKSLNGNLSTGEQEKRQSIQNNFLDRFDRGSRDEFFRLWHEQIPSDLIDQDASLKSLEFLLYAHFAVFFLRQTRNEERTEENMQIFKTYIESIRGHAISQNEDIFPLFGLPYVAAPDRHSAFQEIFTEKWLKELRTKLSNFLQWIFSSEALPSLVGLLQNGERATNVLGELSDKNEQLEYRTRETHRQIKTLSNDYLMLITITMELVETLQQAIVGRIITNEYIDNVCARLGLARLQQSISHVPESSRPGTNDFITEKLDYGKIKRDIVHISTSPRDKAFLLQALRWKLTKAKTDFRREKILECYIGCDLLGCRSDMEQRTKIIQQISSSQGGDTYYVKEEWARFLNTIASLRKGRNYLSPNESLIVCMQKAATAEQTDSLIKQHLLASLQKLSLRRTVQTLLINNNIIKWLIFLLSRTDRLSDYTLEYAVALLMNLCLRTNGRRKCGEIAEQAIPVLSALLTHPNQETRPYVNSSLYSMLTLKSVRDKALELNFDNRLRSLIRTETINSETKGQLEYLLNLLRKGGDQDGRQTSDVEQEDDDEDQDVMEADLDLGDKLKPTDKESSGDQLITREYLSSKVSRSALDYYYSSSKIDPVFQRPVTPSRIRRTSIKRNISAENRLHQSDGFSQLNSQTKKSNNDHRTSSAASSKSIQELIRNMPMAPPTSNDRTRPESSDSLHSSSSSIVDLTAQVDGKPEQN